MIVSLYRWMQESEPRERGCLDPESQCGLSPSSKLMGPRFNAIWRHLMRVGWLFDWLVYDAQKYSVMYWKRPWCWEWLKAGGEGDDRGWDGWRASLTQWKWVWGSFGNWWWTGKPGMLQSMGSQRVGHDWALNWTDSVMWRNVIWTRQTLENSFTFPGLISLPPTIRWYLLHRAARRRQWIYGQRFLAHVTNHFLFFLFPPQTYAL